jgi:sugar phosphate isomerase/epimerase
MADRRLTVVPSGIVLGGIGDEAAPGLAGQIAAHARLGWPTIELRTVDGEALADLDDDAFERLRAAVDDAGLRVSCVDSRIANWGRPISGNLGADVAELATLAPRCRALGTRYLRIMSYPNDGLTIAQWGAEVVRRIRVLTAQAADEGLILLHENCAGWAGDSAERTLRLLDAVDSPALRLIFDIGNGIAYGYQPFDFLSRVVDAVAHVHVKDGLLRGGEPVWTNPGGGECRVVDCLRLLAERGWTGVWSIEPHLNVQPHAGNIDAGDTGPDAFVAYGRRLEELLRTADLLPGVNA